MKNLIKIVIIICGTWLWSYYLDWRFSFVWPFLIILLVPHRWAWVDLVVGFFSVFVVWLTAALVIDGGNDSILSSRLAHIFGLPNGPTLVVFCGLLGGILGSLGSLSGHFLNKSLLGTNDPSKNNV